SGLDANRNGSLEESEVSSTAYICNGEDGSEGEGGLSSVIATYPEPAGANCSAGGWKIESGLDANRNGVLEEAEASSTAYICNGATGADGTDGTDGNDGLNALLLVLDEPAGANCTTGGTRIDTGMDSNG